MGTPVGKPAKSNVLDYAPRHLREAGGPRRVDEDATPPPRPADEEPLDDVGADDEQNDIPLAPEAPHDEIGGETGRDHEDPASDDERVYRLHAHRSEDDAPQDDEPARSFEEDVGPASGSFEDDIAQLAALLESIRHGNEPGEQRPAPPPRRIGVPPPPGAERESDIYIEGMRVPRSLQPSYMPPPPLAEPGAGYGKIVGGVAAACLIAAALAFLMVRDWPASTRVTAAQSAPAPAAVANQPTRAARPASAPAPYAVASVAPTVEAPPATATQQANLTAMSPAPRSVPVVRVAPTQAPTPTAALAPIPAPWPPNTPARAAPPAVPVAPSPTAAPAAQPMPAPPPRTPQHAMDAQEIKLLLDQGKQFISVGDLATARIVLQRVADADVAAGALALGETYDPVMLAKLGVRGLQGDAEQARRWYERARDLGSDEATNRLALMAHP